MNKSQLISTIAETAGISLVQAEQSLQAALQGIVEALKDGNEVTLVGFGRFGVKKRKSRKVRNPRTGVEMTLNASLVPYFKAGKTLKETVDTIKS